MTRTAAAILLAVLTFGAARAQEKDEDTGRLSLVPDAGGHHGRITRVLFTKDGKRLVSVGLDRSVRLWEVETGLPTKVLWFPASAKGGPGGHLHDASLSANGNWLAVAGTGYGKKIGTPVFIVSMETFEVVQVLNAHAAIVEAVAFAPNGMKLATGDFDGQIVVWDVAAGKKLWSVKAHTDVVSGIAFSPDGTAFASVGKDKFARIWSVATGAKTAELSLAGYKLRKTIAWGRDNKGSDQIAVSLADDKPGNIWADGFGLWRPDGTFLRKVHHNNNVQAATEWLGFSANNGGIASVVWGDRLRISRTGPAGKEFALYSDKNPNTEEAPTGPCAFSRDGTYLAAAGDRNRQIYLYDARKGGAPLRTFGGRGRQITGVGWKTDSKTARDIVWKTDLVGPDFAAANDIPKDFFQRAFSLDQLRPGTSGNGPFSWHQRQAGTLRLEIAANKGDVLLNKGKKQVATLQLPYDGNPWVREQGLSFVGSERAVISRGPLLGVFETPGGKHLHNLVGRAGPTLAVAPSPDGKYLLGGGEDQILHIWDPVQRIPILNVFVAGQDWVAWTEEGYYAASPGGERMIGFVSNNGYEKLATFHPVERFRKQLHRPDVIKLVLEKGSVKAALLAANAKLPAKLVPAEVKVEQLIPPQIVLRKDNENGQRVTVTATASAAVPSQPVQALRLYLDGRPMAGNDTKVDFHGTPKAEKTWTVELPPGRHELTVLASGPATAAWSDPIAVTTPLPLELRPRMHVVAVGINAYRNGIPLLRNAKGDADAMVAALKQHCTGPNNRFQEVIVHTPAGALAPGSALTDTSATRTAVLGSLGKARAAAQPGDLVVFFFAGHGVTQGDQFYLLTIEADMDKLPATAIPAADFREQLAGMKCPTLAILDACHSAAGVKQLLPATDQIATAASADDVRVTVLTAAMGDEKALESPDGGLLTKAFTKALSGRGIGFNPDDRTIYIPHLYVAVFNDVQLDSKGKQHPFLQMPWNAPALAIRKAP